MANDLQFVRCNDEDDRRRFVFSPRFSFDATAVQMLVEKKQVDDQMRAGESFEEFGSRTI